MKRNRCLFCEAHRASGMAPAQARQEVQPGIDSNGEGSHQFIKLALRLGRTLKPGFVEAEQAAACGNRRE